MTILKILDRMDYDISLPRYIKKSSRAIIQKNDKITMLYSNKYDFYCFPGGGIEKGETKIDALIRETREETGLNIIPKTIKEFGKIIEIRKDLQIEGIYEQHEFYYTCETENKIFEQNLTQDEIESGYQLVFVSIDEAIIKNELGLKMDTKYTEAETYVLKMLRK